MSGLKKRALPAAWLSLDIEDSDPSLFFQYLIAALPSVDPQVGHVSLSQLKSPRLSSEKAILSALINDLAKIQGDFALILNDYHWIEKQEIRDSLTYLIDHLPAQMHVLIASRSDPPLSLSRLRARHQPLELRHSDLRMMPKKASESLMNVWD